VVQAPAPPRPDPGGTHLPVYEDDGSPSTGPPIQVTLGPEYDVVRKWVYVVVAIAAVSNPLVSLVVLLLLDAAPLVIVGVVTVFSVPLVSMATSGNLFYFGSTGVVLQPLQPVRSPPGELAPPEERQG
jgi:hypothetical protein